MTDEMRFASEDELLSAYIDGLLSPARIELLERRLQQEPDLARRLEQIAQANQAVHDAYAPDIDEPLPQRVLDLLEDARHAETAVADVIQLAARRPVTAPQSFSWSAAIAASITLAVGVLLGTLMSSGGAETDLAQLVRAGVVDPGTPLHAVLETGPSGSIQNLGTEIKAMPILSFSAQNGEFCRQIELGGTDVAAEALACRREGGWQLDALGFLPDRPFSGNLGGFRPAGAGSNVIDAVIDERIAGEPLDAAAEQALIGAGWIAR
jgi:AcrR family transcriptional regulator